MSPPVAVILAAGVGRRLAASSDGRPKALLELNGRTLLGRALDALDAASFEDVVIVTGYRAELVEAFVAQGRWRIRVRSRYNPEFATANNVVSFLTVADDLRDGFCLINSDTIFDPGILVDVAQVIDGSWLVVDADEPLGDEEMKVQLGPDGTIRRINKSLPAASCAGEYIGIARLDARGARLATQAARALVAGGRTDLYYEDAFDAAARELRSRPLPVRGRPWTEIDDAHDLERAERVAGILDGRSGP